MQMRTLTTILLTSLIGAAYAAPDKPNIVLIYGDDVGYGDVKAYNPESKIPTPNIDKLASEGLMFTDGHCTAATCTPSRYSMLTGNYGFREKVAILQPNAPLIIPQDKITLPGVLQKAGYQTAIIGKWHLGIGEKGKAVDWNGDVKPGPLEVGFDYSFLLPSTNDRVPCVLLDQYRVLNLDPKDPLYVGKKPQNFTGTTYPDAKKNPEAMTYYESSVGHNNSVINGIGRIGFMWGGKAALWNDENLTDIFVEQTRSYLDQRDKEKPFFLFYSAQDIHVPRAPHKRFQGKTNQGHRGDSMVAFDWAVGEIMDMLQEKGLAENTIVIFSSDNGPVFDDGYKDGTHEVGYMADNYKGHDANGPFTGSKCSIHEAGTRVPFIIKWPGKIQPGTSAALVSQIDFLASFADHFNVPVASNEAIDSRNTMAAFTGEDKTGLPYTVEEAFSQLAIRQGNWKYIPEFNKQKAALYNLDTDIAEKNNIIAEHPEKAAEMNDLLEKIKASSEGGIRALEAK